MNSPSSSTDLPGFLIRADEDCALSEFSIANGERGELLQAKIGNLLGGIDFGEDGRQVLLVRPTTKLPGLMAYYQVSGNCRNKEINKRATCFAMTCGLFDARFFGDVALLTVMPVGGCTIDSKKSSFLSIEQMWAACKTPDVRPEILCKIAGQSAGVSEIIADAVSNNYLDRAVLKRFQDVMKEREMPDDESGDGLSSLGGEGFNFVLGKGGYNEYDDVEDDVDDDDGLDDEDGSRSAGGVEFAVTRVPLCLHCRRPASTLCPHCKAVYFCDAPRKCREEGWSHDCLCPTWSLYEQRRSTLSSFPLDSWTQEIVTRQCELSDEPYEQFLKERGIQRSDSSWWKAEFGGWLGECVKKKRFSMCGSSDSARNVDVETDKTYTYAKGFAPILDIPPEHDIPIEVLKANNWDDELGLRRLGDWSEYYELRGIPLTSPVALLLTYPLTLYYAIVEYGMAPCKVARMMERPLRIDIVGVEKELIFLPLFKEVAFLLPDDLSLDLVFVVRPDMMPESMRAATEINAKACNYSGKLKISVLSGTYGDSLDPLFDCGRSGPPDMVVSFNAGLYAYESWRSVVEFLTKNRSTTGVFTDYNEWSGVQCACLGGGASRKGLRINPFRQPRAMPVYCMNLPQFSNGFLYVFNENTDTQ